MAGQIALRSEDSARAWSNKAEALNKECEGALQAVASTLKLVDDGGAGELVDQVVQIGNQVFEYTNRILDGMQQITSTIVEIFSVAKDVIGNVVSFLGKGLLG